MAFEINQNETVTVTAYSLHEFAFDLTYLGSKGFTCSLENQYAPYGGLSGGMYNATLVKLTDYYIDKDGNHVNVPKTEDTQPEVKLHTEEPKQDVESVPTTQNEKVQPKTRTTTKKTT